MQTDQSEISERATIRFGPFSVHPGSRLLIRDGREIPIGSRAFDLMVALLRARGQLVDKNEIVRSVWPSTTVDESNIRFQIASLRKALGPEGDLIKTIPGRGYLLADPEPKSETVALQQSPLDSGLLPDWLKPHPGPIPSEDQYVAIVDDDPSTLKAMAGLLRCAGLRVEAFQSARALLESDQAYPPKCIVLDAWLPGQGGLDFQEKLLRAGANVPIIFISGHADIAMSVRAIKAGAFDFLTKPVRHEDLLNAISLAGSEAAT